MNFGYFLGMKLSRLLMVILGSVMAGLSVSCATTDPNELSPDGPTSKYNDIGWNRRLPGVGEGALGGFGSR